MQYTAEVQKPLARVGLGLEVKGTEMQDTGDCRPPNDNNILHTDCDQYNHIRLNKNGGDLLVVLDTCFALVRAHQ